jgi:sugar lactone lactonase YvrE
MVRKIWMLATAALTFALGQAPALAQYGPPSSGDASAIEFVPAIVELVAGLNGYGYTGDNGPATAATLQYPVGIAYDSTGNLYIADSENYVIRKVDTAGKITTVAGNNMFPGTLTAPPANTQATAWSIGATAGMAVDSKNDFYFSDTSYNVIWKVDAGTGVITVFAGTPGTPGYTGNTGPATSATLDDPLGLAFDASGNLYVSDFLNHVVRMIGTDGKINTFAGDGSGAGNQFACPALSGLGGLATTVGLCYPEGIAADTAGNVYIADYYDNIVLIVGSNGKINAFAGTGAYPGSSSPTYSGDGGPATSAELWRPYGVYWTAGGVLYIADQFGELVRQVDASGNIHTVYGDTYGGEFTKALLGLPDTEPNAANAGFADGIEYISMDPFGNLITADGAGSAILTAGSTGGYTFPETNVYTTSSPYYLVVFNPSGVPLKFTDTPPVITGPFAITTGATAGTCVLSSSGSVAPGTSCTIGLTFTPTLDQKYSGSVVFTSNANSSPSTISLFGLGDGSPTYSGTLTNSLTFTSTVGVTTAPMTATFTNTGNAPLAVTANNPPIVSANTAAQEFALASTDCPASLAAGDVCHFYVTFDPTVVTPEFEPDTARLEVAVSNYGNLYTNLSGSAMPAAAPAASLSPGALNFGGVQIDTTSPPLIETVTNTGAGTLNISGVSIAQTGTNVFFLGTGASQCTNTTALGAGQSCNVYITFKPTVSGQTSNATLNIADNASPSPQTATLTGVGDYFHEPIGSSSSIEPVSVFITTAGTLSGINVVTMGAANQDFVMKSGGTCATGTAYTVGQLCTVNVVFTPQYSNNRNGSVFLTDASGNVLGTTNLQGFGEGPQIVFDPGVANNVTISTGAQIGPGVAVDGAGNLYLNDTARGTVVQIPWNGTSYGAAVTIGTEAAFGEAESIAVDGAGNVYVGTQDATEDLFKIPWTGSAWGTPVQIPVSGVYTTTAFGVAVDLLGNVYFVDRTNDLLVKVPWTGSGYGPATSLPVTGMAAPFGVAVDGNLNLYVADIHTNTIYFLPWNGTGYGTQTTVPLTGLTLLTGIAVDGNDDVYVAGTSGDTSEVVEIPWTGSSNGPQFVLSGSGSATIAVDGAGNVYGNSGEGIYLAGSITKIDLADPPSLTFASTDVGSASSDSPKTVSVANIGNEDLYFNNIVYPTDFPEGNGASQCNNEFPLNAGSTCNLSIDFTPTTGGLLSENVTLTDNNLDGAAVSQSIPVSATGILISAPVAVLSPNPLDFGGQVVSTSSLAQTITLSNTGNAPLTGITPAISGSNPGSYSLTTGANACGATLAAAGTCNFYVIFTPQASGGLSATFQVADNASGSPQAISLTGNGDQFSSNVGQPQGNQPVTVYFSAAGSPGSIQVLTQGIANLDFTFAPGGTCSTDTVYSVGQSCTVNVSFDPQAPGARNGAVELVDNEGDVLGTAYLPGIGYGPEIAFEPGTQSTLPNFPEGGYSAPLGVTVDAALDVYVVDTLNNRIIELPWTGASYGTAVKLPTIALNQPSAVAIDGSGNLFIADTKNNRIVEELWTGSSYGTQVTLDQTGLPDPDGIAVDGNGNVYFADGLDQKLVELPWTGAGYGAPVTIAQATGLHSPHGVAVDAGGDVFIADSDNSRVVELPWTNSGFGTEVVVATGLFYPEAVVVDGGGNAYIGNTDAGTVVMVPFSDSSFGNPITLPISVRNSNGVAVDQSGNVYVADATNSDVVELNVSNPPALSFASTNVDSTSSDSPKTVNVYNIGNIDLYFNAEDNNPVYPINFPENNNDENLCQEDNSVRPGSNCDVNVNFTPTTGGNLSGFVVLSNNNLNQEEATQSISVQGIGIAAIGAQVINFTQPASPVTYASGLTVQLVATGGASGNPVVFTIDESSTGKGSVSGSTLTITGVGTLVIDANQAGNDSYSAAPQVQRTLVVTQAPQTIKFTQPASPVTYSSGLSVPLVATGGASGNAVVFTIDESSTATGSISGSTLTVTGTGTLIIDANQAGNANYSAAPQVQRTLAVNAPIPQAINFTQPASVTYAPSLTVSLAATGGASGNPVVFTIDASSTGTGSISGSMLTVTGVGMFVIDANQAGNTTYTAAPQVQKAFVVSQAPQAINFTQPTTPVVFTTGLAITLTATGGASGSAVVFTLDESSTATASISGNTVTVAAAGNLVIDANQAGNADYSAAPQVQRTVLVNPPPPDFTITATPSSQTIAAGASAAYTVTLAATNGNFNNVIALSSSGLPTGANGTFNPATINPDNGKATSTLTVQLAPALQASSHGSSWPLATPGLALLFLLPFRRWRKAWRGKLLLLVAGLVSLASIVNLTGCGGGFLLGSPQQTYTITITGASGNDTHSTTVQLTVK